MGIGRLGGWHAWYLGDYWGFLCIALVPLFLFFLLALQDQALDAFSRTSGCCGVFLLLLAYHIISYHISHLEA